jgi:hypothetical protein
MVVLGAIFLHQEESGRWVPVVVEEEDLAQASLEVLAEAVPSSFDLKRR